MSGDQSAEDLAKEITRRLDDFKGHLEQYQEKVRRTIVEDIED